MYHNPDEERTTPGAESTAHTTKVVTETSTSEASVDEPSTGSGIASMCGYDCVCAIYMLLPTEISIFD